MFVATIFHYNYTSDSLLNLLLVRCYELNWDWSSLPIYLLTLEYQTKHDHFPIYYITGLLAYCYIDAYRPIPFVSVILIFIYLKLFWVVESARFMSETFCFFHFSKRTCGGFIGFISCNIWLFALTLPY